jgi:cholesterol transport system auxiliary component
MMRAAPRIARRWLAGGAALALAGCASLFVAIPPGNLYRLAPAADFPTNLRHVSAQLLIELPQVPAGIDTARIALSKSPISLDYYADSLWTDRVPGLLKNLLVASFENSRAITAFGRDSISLRADFILQTEIRHFEAVYDTAGGPPRIWVAIIARLVAMPRRAIIAQMRFEQRVPAAANEVPAIVTAFNGATDAVLRDVVLWTLDNLALSRSQR